MLPKKRLGRGYASNAGQLQLEPDALLLVGGLHLLNLLGKRIGGLGALGGSRHLRLKRRDLRIPLSQRSTVILATNNATRSAIATGGAVAITTGAYRLLRRLTLRLRRLLPAVRLLLRRRPDLLPDTRRLRAINLTVHANPFRQRKNQQPKG